MIQLIKRFFCPNIDNLLRKDPRMNRHPQLVIWSAVYLLKYSMVIF